MKSKIFSLAEGEEVEGAIEFRDDHIADAEEVGAFLQLRQEFFEPREKLDIVLDVGDGRLGVQGFNRKADFLGWLDTMVLAHENLHELIVQPNERFIKLSRSKVPRIGTCLPVVQLDGRGQAHDPLQQHNLFLFHYFYLKK